MVSLTKRNQSCQDVVPWRVTVIEGLIAEPVRKRVNAESGLLDDCTHKLVISLIDWNATSLDDTHRRYGGFHRR
jgi:hypothetical protein